MNPGRHVRLLRVIARLNVGGPARQALLLHERLPSFGFDCQLVHGCVGPGEASLEPELETRRLSSVRLPDLGRRIHPWSDLQAFLQLVRLMFATQPDVVHTHTAKAGTLGRLAARLYNLTRPKARRALVVHTFHGHVFHGYFSRSGSLAVRIVERLLARMTDRVVAISQRQRADLVDRYRVAPANRVVIVPLGLELDPFFELGPVDHALRRELGFPDATVLFGYIGRLVTIKALPTLLDAFARAHEQVPNVRLVIVGDGDQRAILEERTKSLGIEEEVRFVGWRYDLATIYGGLDAVVLSSLNEGTPVTLIEAMAAGRPTVATDVGGVPDVVADGETGWIVPPADPRALADAMVRLANSPEERFRLGAAGRDVADRFRAERLLTSLAALYRDGLAAKRGIRGDAGSPAEELTR